MHDQGSCLSNVASQYCTTLLERRIAQYCMHAGHSSIPAMLQYEGLWIEHPHRVEHYSVPAVVRGVK